MDTFMTWIKANYDLIPLLVEFLAIVIALFFLIYKIWKKKGNGEE